MLEDQQNVRPIKELLQILYISLCSLVQDMGKSVLVGNINTWVHRMENIMQWQQQLDTIQINRVSIYRVTTILIMDNLGKSGKHFHNIHEIFIFFLSARIYRHDTDRPARQSTVEHHAASV